MAKKPETDRPLQTLSFPPETLDRLRRSGFDIATIGRAPERVRVLRGNCAFLFEKKTDGSLTLFQKPGYLVKGDIARLWDAGYQKFWLRAAAAGDPFDEKRKPALAAQLKELGQFEEDIRDLLGLPSFYNEAIGSTSKVTAYDRLEGRDVSL